MSRTDPQFNLRIPEALRDLVMAAAKENKRSATAEILDRLESSFSKRDRVRKHLGLPLIEPEYADEEDEEDLYPGLSERPEDEVYHVKPVSGVSKEKLISSIEDKPLTKRDLNDAMMDAVMQVLDTLRAAPPGTSTPTKGPEPRKKYPKS